MTKKKKVAKRWSEAEKRELYRQYLMHGRKWSKFAHLFNTTQKSISKTFDRINWDEFIEENDLDINEMAIGTIPEKSTEEQADILIQARKNRIKKEADAKRLKNHIEEIASRDIIFDKIAASIEKVPPIQVSEIIKPFKPNSQTGPQEGFLLFGDCHIGLAVSEEEVGGLGRYNVDIFQERVENLVNTVAEITDLHRNQHEMKRLNICMFGDLVHGSNDAGKWGFLHTEQNIMDQVFLAMDAIPRAILKLKKKYDEIRVFCVYGNHGRVGKRGVEKQFVNWDYLIYHNIKTALSNQEGIEFYIPKANFNIAEAMGHKFLLIHGDNVRSWNGIPWYGLTRIESRYRAVLSRNKKEVDIWKALNDNGIDPNTDPEEAIKFIASFTRPFDYLICGHFHSLGEIETSSGGRIILNSSFIGGDQYSINDLVLSNSPSQKFFGVNKHRKTWSYDIDLDKK
ncbi:MAG TPA: metallophosphoesterase [Candidatus Paceibacterota bacterium]|nr:metallophosphoesterase [Candidatus Paceibacterota bacterium]